LHSSSAGQNFDEPENVSSVTFYLAFFILKITELILSSPVFRTRFRHRRTNGQRRRPADWPLQRHRLREQTQMLSNMVRIPTYISMRYWTAYCYPVLGPVALVAYLVFTIVFTATAVHFWTTWYDRHAHSRSIASDKLIQRST